MVFMSLLFYRLLFVVVLLCDCFVAFELVWVGFYFAVCCKCSLRVLLGLFVLLSQWVVC